MDYQEYDNLRGMFIDTFVNEVQPGAQGPQPSGQETERIEIKLSLDPDVSPEEAPVVLVFNPAPVRTSISSGSDPRGLGEWAFYYWQMKLWEWYVAKETLLLGTEMTVEKLDSLLETANKTRETVWTFAEIDPEDGEPKEWFSVNREYPPLPAPGPTQAEGVAFIRQQAELQGGRITGQQNPLNYELEWQGLYQIYQDAAYAITADEHDRYFGLINRLRERQEDRDRYYAWIEDRKAMVIDFATDWARKYDGTEFDIDGVTYLVSGEPLAGVPETARNLVIDRMVTPYDILEPDGSRKMPIALED